MKKQHLTAALLILQVGRSAAAQEVSFGSCQIFGQVFGIDPLGGDMLVKSPSAYIGGLRFDQTTAFARASFNANPAAPARITPPEVNNGDLICGRRVTAGNPGAAESEPHSMVKVRRVGRGRKAQREGGEFHPGANPSRRSNRSLAGRDNPD
jgi:hypothetical protein